ncbi:MAG: hypothetical protein M3042_09145 [Actinomycetota bacterium]|nr:hypothetical protein [Actinomycetota bacterium]
MTSGPAFGAAAAVPSISVPAALWELGADPAAIRAWAAGLQELGTSSDRAHELVTPVADQLYETWHGSAAGTWNEHRSALYADLGRTSAAAWGSSQRLLDVARTLEQGQRRLTDLRDTTCAGCPATAGGAAIEFHPADPSASDRVLEHVRQAEQIRAELADSLRGVPAALGEYHDAFDQIDSTWAADTSKTFTKPKHGKAKKKKSPDPWGQYVDPRPSPPKPPPKYPPPLRPLPVDGPPPESQSDLGSLLDPKHGLPVIPEPPLLLFP